ncbi:unnamed protein product, partial [Heterosigma akashiwo]
RIIKGKLDVLQLAPNRAQFKSAGNCLKEELSKDSTVASFASHWHSKFVENDEGQHQVTTWYEGVNKKTPAVNNSLESQHKRMKTDHLLNTKRTLPLLLNQSLDIISMWHRQAFLHADLQGPRLTPTADLKVDTEAFKWITAGANWVDSEIQVLDGTTLDQPLPVVLIPSRARVESGHLPADRTELRKLLEQYAFPALPFRAFSHYEQCKTSVYVIWCFDGKEQGKPHWICSCYVGLKQKICKHVVGVQAMKGIYTLREEAKDLPIRAKRKRGRPKK